VRPTGLRLGLLGLAAYLLILAGSLPAAVVLPAVAPPGLVASGVEGSVWRGSAATVAVAGQRLHGVRWSLQPLQLLRGRLGYRMAARLEGGFAEGLVAWSPVGAKLVIMDGRAALALQPLTGAVGFGGVAGQLSVDLGEAVIQDGWPTALEARLGLGQLRISDLGRDPVGDYELVLGVVDNRITGRLADRAGPLEVQAELQLSPDLRFELQGEVAPRPQAPADLSELLGLLGPADERGRRPFGISGRL
jgi:general secretion pathway protein N